MLHLQRQQRAGPQQTAAVGSGLAIAVAARQVNGASGQTSFSCALQSHTDITHRAAQERRCFPVSFFFFSLSIPHHVIYIMLGTRATEHMTWPQTEASAERKAVWKS